MRIPFRQGIVSFPTSASIQVGLPRVNLVVGSSPVVAAVASGTKDYLWIERETVTNAWTVQAGADVWLYIDIDQRTGVRTFNKTSVTPTIGPVAPSSPVPDQHWFDSTSSTMKVWSGVLWQPKIRVFVCKLSGGVTVQSVSANAPSMIGTQVGDNNAVFAGTLLFSAENLPLKSADGKFVTTEDRIRSPLVSTADVRLASITVEAQAVQPLARYSIVKFIDFGQVIYADRHVAERAGQFGIIETDTVTGDLVNVVTSGVVTNLEWDWTSVGINTILYNDNAGAITTTEQFPGQVPIGVVVDKHTIQLGSPQITLSNTYVGSTTPMTTDASGVAKVSVAPSDPTNPIVVGTNDPRMSDARTPLAHTHTTSDITDLSTTLVNYVSKAGSTMTGALTLSGTPTTDLQAATKRYVDDAVTNVALSGGVVSVNGKAGVVTLGASDVAIVDAGNKYTATNVETALQEAAVNIASNTSSLSTLQTTVSNITPGETNTGTNLGAGTGVYASKSGAALQFKSIVAGSNISLSTDANTITITAAASGETNTASNLGTGVGVFGQKVSADLQFKSLIAGSNMTFTSDATSITINGAAPGETNTGANLGAGTGVYATKSGTTLQFKSLVAGSNVTMSNDANTVTVNTVPGGSTTQVQFNDAGVLNGVSTLTFDKSTSTLFVGAAAATGTIRGVTGGSTQVGGTITIQGGQGGSGAAGGSINVIAGGGGTAGGPGTITIKAADLGGGAVTVSGGSSSGGTGGTLTLNGGEAATSANGGQIIARGGDGNTGGAATFRGGDGTANPSTGGNVTIRAGDSNRQTISGSYAPGTLTIRGGNAGGSTNAAAGGVVTITGGKGGAANGSGGDVTIQGGLGQGTGIQGNVNLGGAGAALATTATGGFATLPTCAGIPTGVPASVAAGQAAIVFDSTDSTLYAYNGSWVRAVPGGGGSGTPGGSDTYVQFNDGGVLGGNSALTFNKTTGLLTTGSLITTGPSVSINTPVLNASQTWSANTDTNYANVTLLQHWDGVNGATTATGSESTPLTGTFTAPAQLSTTQVKFGTTSLSLGGSSAQVTFANSSNFDFGSSDFTIEGWAYWTTFGNDTGLVSKWLSGGDSWSVNANNGTFQFIYKVGASQFTVTGSTVVTGVWTHWAVVRSGGTIYLFVNGSQVGTATISGAIVYSTLSSVMIGMGATTNYYMDDVRITKGFARYTSNFAVPTAAFPGTSGSTNFTALQLNVTDNSSSVSSLLLDLQKAGVSQFKVSKTGDVTANTVTATSLTGTTVTSGQTSGNYLVTAGATTGGTPSVTAAGVDTNIDVNVVTKGTGQLKVNGAPISTIGMIVAEFNVAQTSTPSTTAAGWQKVPFSVAVSDPSSWWDSVNLRYQPKAPGWYWMSASIGLTGGTGLTGLVFIKNGANGKSVAEDTSGQVTKVAGGCWLYLNGTTDYVEAYIYCYTAHPFDISLSNQFTWWQVTGPYGSGTASSIPQGIMSAAKALVYLSAATTTGAVGWQKVPVDLVSFDTNSFWNAANKRFIPTIPGYYYVSGRVRTNTTGTETLAVSKNGTLIPFGNDYAGQIASSGNTLVYCNGTTDYLELFAYFSSSTLALTANSIDTWFQMFGPLAGSTSPTVFPIACTDETTGISTTGTKVTFRMPYAMTLQSIRASLTTSQAVGSAITVNVLQNGTSLFSTKITIDNTTTSSKQAAVQSVLASQTLTDDAQITVSVDQVGDGTATGLKVYLIGYV